MLSVLCVIVLVIGSINAINFYQKSREQNDMLEFLTSNDGSFPNFKQMKDNVTPPEMKGENNGENGENIDSNTAPEPKDDDNVRAPRMNAETKFKTRFFAVFADENNNITTVRTDNIAAVDESEATEYASNILKSGSSGGWSGIYKYRVVTTSDNNKLIVFLDCTEDINAGKTLLLISLVIGAASLLIVLLLVSLFSKKAIKPFAESVEKQKQFITDASHEIKTPLAIISANADVLSITEGENEWITSIQNQTRRLSRLVKNLVSLAKMDEENTCLSFEKFNLSEAMLDTSASFDPVAQKYGKTIADEIEPDLMMNGNEETIRQLASILLDNAVKYSLNDSEIKVRIYKKSKSVHIEVSNKADNVDEKNLNRLFDRFYRSDEARARAENDVGGYGVGLSIAKAIVGHHKGKISASYDNNLLTMTVVLPQNI